MKITGIPEEELGDFKNPGFDTITKSAIKHSDAVVIGHPEVEKQIISYIEENKELSVMHHPEKEDYVDDYEAFYDELLKNS